MWFDAAWLNEFTLLIPGLLWPTVRTTPAQRVLDVLRTVPIVATVCVHVLASPVPLYAWIAVAAWTVLANLAQYRLDTHADPPFSEITYMLLHLSVLHWLTFSLAPNAAARALGVAINVAAAAYMTSVILFAVPLAKAWVCYPSKDPTTFTLGYCPQYTGVFKGNRACEYKLTGAVSYNPRCDPRKWKQDPPVHDLISHTGHVVASILIASLAFHLAWIKDATDQARIDACIAVTHYHKRK